MGEVWLAENVPLERLEALKILSSSVAAIRSSSRGFAARRARSTGCATRTSSRCSTSANSPMGGSTSRWSMPRADNVQQLLRTTRVHRAARDSRARSARASACITRTRAGCVHRDLKPSNLIVAPRRHAQGARLRDGEDRRARPRGERRAQHEQRDLGHREVHVARARDRHRQRSAHRSVRDRLHRVRARHRLARRSSAPRKRSCTRISRKSRRRRAADVRPANCRPSSMRSFSACSRSGPMTATRPLPIFMPRCAASRRPDCRGPGAAMLRLAP